MATKKPMKKPVKRVRRFQEGGEAALKAEGLAASNKDAPLGFFESLRRFGQGNIDQEGSEAYNRYGAGRGRMERDAKSEADAMRMVDAMNASNKTMNARTAPAAEQSRTYAEIAEGDDAARGLAMRTAAESEKDYKKYTGPIAKPVAVAENAAILTAKPSRKTTGDFTKLDRKALLPSGPNVKFAPGGAGKRGSASAEELAASLAAAPRNGASATTTQSVSAPSESKFNASDALGLGLAAVSVIPIVRKGKTLYQVGNKIYQTFRAAKDAIKNRPKLDRPGTVSGEGFVMRDVKDPSAVTKAPQKALPAPRKGDITDVTPKNTNPRSLIGEAREDAKADRFRRGLDELSAKQMAEKNLRERGNKFLFADDAMKRGGRVKKMAHGGSIKSTVSTASKRGDGIALRGKTRGKMY